MMMMMHRLFLMLLVVLILTTTSCITTAEQVEASASTTERSATTATTSTTSTTATTATTSTTARATSGGKTSSSLEPWQQCSIFIAPSVFGGYGVFAGRDFQENEIVELAPFFLPADHETPFVVNSALQDYIYGYLRETDPAVNPAYTMAVVVWGMTMIYNHHSQAPNINWASYGREPTSQEPHTVRSVGFSANRFIQAGEELFSTYGRDDGGTRWFADRHLTMTTPDVTRIPIDQLQQYQEQYCSKMYAEMDRFIYTEHMALQVFAPLFYDLSRLAPSHAMIHSSISEYDDPQYPWAIARVAIPSGQRIELAPALVLDRHSIVNTAMAPLVYYWHDLTPELQASVRELRTLGYYVVQYQGLSNGWRREDHFTSLEDAVILPMAGWIGRVDRVGSNVGTNSNEAGATSPPVAAANCQMNILPSNYNRTITSDTAAKQKQEEEKEKNPFSLGNAGITLELIATRDIAVGERIRVNLPPPSTTLKERIALYKEMEQSGQIYTVMTTGRGGSGSGSKTTGHHNNIREEL